MPCFYVHVHVHVHAHVFIFFLGAIAALESLTSIRHRAGVIATLVALYERANDTDGAVRILNQAVEEAKKQVANRRGARTERRGEGRDASDQLKHQI